MRHSQNKYSHFECTINAKSQKHSYFRDISYHILTNSFLFKLLWVIIIKDLMILNFPSIRFILEILRRPGINIFYYSYFYEYCRLGETLVVNLPNKRIGPSLYNSALRLGEHQVKILIKSENRFLNPNCKLFQNALIRSRDLHFSIPVLDNKDQLQLIFSHTMTGVV